MDYVNREVQIVFLVTNIILFIWMVHLKAEDFLCLPEGFSFEFFGTVSTTSRTENISHLMIPPNNLLNMTNFKYLLNNKTVCPPKENTWKILLIIVPSARGNIVGRNSIRETWGAVKSYKNWRIRTIFLLGIRKFVEDYNLIQESEDHGDLIQGNFIDSYKTMTFKHAMAYKWTLGFCPQADYLFKVDDDVFVNLFTIVDLLNENKDIDLVCPIILDQRKVERNVTTNKLWHVNVTEQEFKSTVYPPYCMGTGYLISNKWLDKIYSTAAKLNFFGIDDIFITGITREQAQIEAKEKMTLLSLDLLTHVLIDVDPDVFIKNYFSFNSSNNSYFDQYPAMYATIKRKDTFQFAMHFLWEHILKIA